MFNSTAVKTSVAAAIVAAVSWFGASTVSAAPLGQTLMLKDAMQPQAETVQWRGRHFYGGPWRGGWHRGWRGPGPFVGGLAAGALIGGSLAYGAYAPPPPAYYAPGYVGAYPDNYVDNYDYGAYAGRGYPDGDANAYCAQRYRSYDPASGTYLGYDGQRHPCP